MSFFTPSKDKCLTCINFEKAIGEDKHKLEKIYEEHIARKEAANKRKNMIRTELLQITALLV